VQVFGLSGLGEKRHHEVPPQFMTDLYNNIADGSGVSRRRNPYNAKVVRSFIERGKHPVIALEQRRSFKYLHHTKKILLQFDIEDLY
jgi:hypothetical protein